MQPKMTISRAVIYAALILFALYFLFPLYVMLSTSFKDIDQLRTGNLLTPPSHPTFAPWIKAWSQACTGVRCDGMEPFFMNSVRMVIPAVLISSIIGAFNGYVLTHWRFRGADILFTM
jgi:glucose/mannose transport system permease protein